LDTACASSSRSRVDAFACSYPPTIAPASLIAERHGVDTVRHVDRRELVVLGASVPNAKVWFAPGASIV